VELRWDDTRLRCSSIEIGWYDSAGRLSGPQLGDIDLADPDAFERVWRLLLAHVVERGRGSPLR
jgi:hypothetical protein